jgi:Ribosome inactivating protein
VSTYAIVATRRLGFGNEYKQLGYDRTSAITVTLDNVNGALAAFYNATPTTDSDVLKSAFLFCAIAFAEAVRFDDVLLCILKGEPITDIDWTMHKDQARVRVVQTKAG